MFVIDAGVAVLRKYGFGGTIAMQGDKDQFGKQQKFN
jgi:hypothetical protein